MRKLLQRSLERKWKQGGVPVWPALVLVGSMATTLAIVSAPRTTAQARLSALPLELPATPDNPSTPDRVALGRLLFWDPILSGQKDVACATCHHPAFGYSDGLDLSIGANGAGLGPSRAFAPGHTARPVKRNSQSVLNVAFNGLTTGDAPPPNAPMFWDLRVRSLEAQALEPLKAQDEMRGSAYAEDHAVSAVVSRLNAIAGVPPAVRSRVRRKHAGERAATSGARSPLPADARGGQRAVRPLHARRHDGARRRAGPRHGAVPVGRLHQLSQRTDVLGLRARTCSRCRTTRSWRNRTPA